MFYWLHDLPTWGMVLLISSVFLAITWLGTLFIRPVLRAFLRSHPDRATYVSYLLGSHGVYFGILLGLLALAAFDNFGRTQAQVAEEASQLASLYRDVDAYPEPARSELKGYLQDYTRYVIDKAWPLQRQGVIPREGTRIVSAFQRALTRFEPQTRGQEILHAEAMGQFNDFVGARRLRLNAVQGGIPAIMRCVVAIGVLTNMFLIWLLDMKLLPHLFLGGANMFFLATLIALVVAMDNPFRGEVSVSSAAYELVYQDLMVETDP